MIASFRVGALARAVRRRIGGGGRLRLFPGAAVFDPGPVFAALTGTRQVVHTDPNVVAMTGRLMPPWVDTAFVLTAGEQTVTVVVPRWLRRRVRAAFGAAGFTLTDRRTWLLYPPSTGRRAWPRR